MPCPWKKCNKCKKKGHSAKVCKELSAEGSRVAARQQDILLSSVDDLIILKIAGKDVQIKADTSAESTVTPAMRCTRNSQTNLFRNLVTFKGAACI